MARKKFSTLREKMSPESRKLSEAKSQEMMAEMALSEIRKLLGFNQTELAEALGIKQASISKMERQQDMSISTLDKIIQALGGQLELTVKLPKINRTIKISQFESV